MSWSAMGAAFAAVMLLPNLACATLGQAESTASLDGTALRGSIKSSQRATYRVHEIQLPSGTVLREYAVAGGTVFAVAWEGPIIPNLRQMLGQYFDTYVGEQVKHASRTHLVIQHDDFVASVSGHMRAFSGRAYLPQALPAGVSVGELR